VLVEGYVRIRGGVGFEGGNQFEENVFRKIGSGVDTCFWTDRWLGKVPLCVRYRRLFELVGDRGISEVDMRELGWGDEGEGWRWRRRLWVWEEGMVRECTLLLSNLHL